MKKTDIAMIVLIASVSVIGAYFATSTFFPTASGGQNQTVKTIEVITSDVAEPDPAVFNENAINPAVEVQVGSSQAPEETVEQPAEE